MEWEQVCNRFEGWIVGDMCYNVAEDEEGWYWEIVGDTFGYGGFDTAEEAMKDAERFEDSKELQEDE